MHSSLYDTLLLKKDCTDEELKESYYKLTRAYNPTSKSGCYEKYLEVIHAYNFLKDTYKRNFYDNFGDTGLSSLTNPRKEYFLTRSFDCANVKLLVTSLILFIMNISLLPLSFHLHACGKATFSMIFMPLIIAHVLLAVFILRSIFHCRKYEIEKMDSEILYMIVFGINNFFILLQLIVMCYIVDFNIDSYRYLWMIPYLLIEIVILIQYLVNNLKKIKHYIELAYPRIPRIICMHLFLLPIDMGYKVFLPLVILMIEMIARRLAVNVILSAIFGFSFVLSCFYVCIVSPYNWLTYTIAAIFIAFGVAAIYCSRMIKMKYEPAVNFCKDPMLDYDI